MGITEKTSPETVTSPISQWTECPYFSEGSEGIEKLKPWH